MDMFLYVLALFIGSLIVLKIALGLFDLLMCFLLTSFHSPANGIVAAYLLTSVIGQRLIPVAAAFTTWKFWPA